MGGHVGRARLSLEPRACVLMVFTSRPRKDPRENLHLRSLLKPTHSEGPEEEDIVFVESNHPNVVQTTTSLSLRVVVSAP